MTSYWLLIQANFVGIAKHLDWVWPSSKSLLASWCVVMHCMHCLRWSHMHCMRNIALRNL